MLGTRGCRIVEAELVERVRDLLGQRGPPFYGADEINGPMIRQWCEMVEDANPVYWDDAAARRTRFGRVISPPCMLRTWLMDRWWKPAWMGGSETADLSAAMPDLPIIQVAESMGYKYAVGVSNEGEYLEPFGPGDGRVFAVRHIPEISVEKRTRLGVGVFFKLVTEFYVETDGRHVATNRMVQFKYRGHEDSSPAPLSSKPAGTMARGSTQALDREPQGPADGGRTRRWEEVRAGERMPPLRLPITVTRCVMAAGGTRDFYPGHHDSAFARNGGAREMFVNTMFNQALLGRFLTDWGGPESFVRRLAVDMREQICAGDTAVVTGRVSAKNESDGRKLATVDLEISTDRYLAVSASASLELM